jgi:hypothetical protein
MASRIGAKIPAGVVRNVINDIGDMLDRLFPAPEEHAKAELARYEIARLPALKQIDRGQPSLFVAGWRPTIGWICALALTWAFLFQPVALWVVTTFGLGIAGLRTIEKTKAR